MDSQVVLLFVVNAKGTEFVSRVIAEGEHSFPLPKEIHIERHPYTSKIEHIYKLPTFNITFDGDDPSGYLRYLKFLRGGEKSHYKPLAGQADTEHATLYILPPGPLSTDNSPIPLKCAYQKKSTPSHPRDSSKSKQSNNQKQTNPTPTPHTTFDLTQDQLAGSVHPRFLMTCSQIHEGWMFGGFAELIHNSFDAKAQELRIEYNDGQIDFIDNGKGMTHKEIVNMLCFGHEDYEEGTSTSNKDGQDILRRIGKFGVGFKTGTMRIGADAIVFTRTDVSQSIGLLSQTLNAGRKSLLVPIVTWHYPSLELDTSNSTPASCAECLNHIKAVTKLKNDFSIQEQFSEVKKGGTRICVFNLRDKELDFSVRDDICLQKRNGQKFVRRRNGSIADYVPLDFSLRAYCEVLFLQPKMLISIRGSRVRTRLMKESQKDIVMKTNNKLNCRVSIGFSPEAKEQNLGGLMMYWRNILIKAYHRVGVQLQNTDAGTGVIGIVECNSLDPLNNKQDFQEQDLYYDTEDWLRTEMDSYWYRSKALFSQEDKRYSSAKVDLSWVQCNKCLKWRKQIDQQEFPEYWYCHNNKDKAHNSCSIPEEDYSNWATITYDNQPNNDSTDLSSSDSLKSPLTETFSPSPILSPMFITTNSAPNSELKSTNNNALSPSPKKKILEVKSDQEDDWPIKMTKKKRPLETNNKVEYGLRPRPKGAAIKSAPSDSQKRKKKKRSNILDESP